MNNEIEALRSEIRLSTDELAKFHQQFSAHQGVMRQLDDTDLKSAQAALYEASEKLSQALTAHALSEPHGDIASLRTQVSKHTKKLATETEIRDGLQRELQATAVALQTLVNKQSEHLAQLQKRHREMVISELRANMRSYLDDYDRDAKALVASHCTMVGLIEVVSKITGQDPGLWGISSRALMVPGFRGQPDLYSAPENLGEYRAKLFELLAAATQDMGGQLVPHAPQVHDTPMGSAHRHQVEIYR